MSLKPTKSRTSPVAMGLLLALTLFAAGIPVATGQGGPGSLTVDLTFYQNNPVISLGEEGEWDSGIAVYGSVIYEDGLFHMFYIGGENFITRPTAVGYATSEDGLTWTKYEGNPVLELEESRSAYGVRAAVPFRQGDTWMLFIDPRTTPGRLPGPAILRATAPAPTGPWTVDSAPVLEAGSGRGWDGSGIWPSAALLSGYEYVFYYSTNLVGTPAIGRATSIDGTTWVKYNDPETTAARYRENDPVFSAGEHGSWDDGFVGLASVLLGENGWEMVYLGGPSFTGPVNDPSLFSIGYAASDDGIHWTRYGDGPILTAGAESIPWSPSAVVVEDTYYIYYTQFPLDALMTPTAETVYEINVVTGIISRE